MLPAKFILILSFCSAVSSVYEIVEENHIMKIGTPNFARIVDEKADENMIYFYHPRCIPCREVWPEIFAAAHELFERKSRVKFGKVDCHADIELCNDLGIKDFPLLMTVRSGRRRFAYEGLLKT